MFFREKSIKVSLSGRKIIIKHVLVKAHITLIHAIIKASFTTLAAKMKNAKKANVKKSKKHVRQMILTLVIMAMSIGMIPAATRK